jgi:hypothetical protein
MPLYFSSSIFTHSHPGAFLFFNVNYVIKLLMAAKLRVIEVVH